jgi:sulfur carrier protein
MRIVVNGEERDVPDGQTVLELVGAFELEPSRVAVAVDNEILKRPDWTARALQPGSRVEIVHFVGGG